MPKAIKMYQKSRSSLEHNMGGWFEKKEPKPKPKPKPEVKKEAFSEAGKQVKESILERNRRLRKALTD